jgi:hypothetical protein
LLTISPGNIDERSLLPNKLTELESSLTKPIFLLKNNDFPFYDTSHSNKVLNSMSLINLNSVIDLENKINQKVEFQRFRANFYVEGIEAWKESNWINKTIKINNVSFYSFINPITFFPSFNTFYIKVCSKSLKFYFLINFIF